MQRKLIFLFILSLITLKGFAETQSLHLSVAYKKVCFTGKCRKAIAVNDQIPGPTLHFKEGEKVTIYVHNLLDKDTAIHWHGMLVPWQMDGVEGITQKGIPPGQTFRYHFTLKQSGTYWYHAHAGLQEQEGLYGAFLIEPKKASSYSYTKDFTIVLSDWSNTPADHVLANLKKEGDFYGPRFPLQPSLMKFIHDYQKASKEEKKALFDDYRSMQQSRMSIYDLSDVAYDAFLLNGHPNSSPWTAAVHVGDVVRLRFIGAGGSSIFNVKIPGATMKMVHADGNDVEPYDTRSFAIAPGETFDVLVKIQKNTPYVIYAESRDTLGAAFGALTTEPHQLVDYKQIKPFPEPMNVSREMMSMMMTHKIQGTLPSHSSKTKHKKPMMKMTHHHMQNGSMSHHAMSDAMTMDSHASMMHQMPSESTNKIPTNTQPKKELTPMNNHMDHMNHDTTSSDMHEKMHHTMSGSSMKMEPSKPHKPKSMTHSQHLSSHDMSMMDGSMKNMNHEMMNHSMKMVMPTEPSTTGDSFSRPTSFYATSSGTKYQNLIAAVATNNPNTPVSQVINMELFGYMERFIWFINGVPEYNAHPILLKPGKRYRFVFTNNSMMHHPMHIHGHWFILRKGHGKYDPLLHTIDVPPGATITADVDTDASGQWFFHCHMLYHMMTGMSRVFQYSTLISITKNEAKPQDIVKETAYKNRPIVRVDELRPIDASLVKHPMAHPAGLWLGNFLDVGADPFNNAQRLTYKGLFGPDYNKLELYANDAEVYKGTLENADMDIFYWHLISQFWAIKAGVNYFNQPAQRPYWQPGIGIEGMMPYFIDTNARLYFYGGSVKLDIELSRDTQITNNFLIRTGVRSILASKTVPSAALGNGLNQMRYIVRPYYRLTPGLNVFVEYENEEDYGQFKSIERTLGEAVSLNTVTIGLTMVF